MRNHTANTPRPRGPLCAQSDQVQAVDRRGGVPGSWSADHKRRRRDGRRWPNEAVTQGRPRTRVLVHQGEPGGVSATGKQEGQQLLTPASWLQNGLPGDPTISSDPKTKVSPPPPIQPDTPRDKHDSDVSLFGSRTSFDGLGIVFDTSPTAPVWRRSDQLVHSDVASVGRVGLTGVVSGIMDDGSQAWLDPEGQVPKGDDEAAYLAKAIGECEAAFRNAQGLLWARIAHYNSTIRVSERASERARVVSAPGKP
jgi:hypothetical protein